MRWLVFGISWTALATPSDAWTPGTYPAPTHGVAVDSSDRNDVVAFWHSMFVPSESYGTFNDFDLQWRGNYTAGSPYTNAEGSNPSGLEAHIERRVNFYRALAGVPAVVRLNTFSTVRIDGGDPYRTGTSPPLSASTTKAAAVQRSAYMIIRTYGTNLAPLGNPNAALSHSPVPGSCVGWTTAAWNGNFRGNLARGFYGPGAIDAYLAENVSGISDWNAGVGHRRWILNPRATDFASGDTPGSYNPAIGEARPPTNALYVIQKAAEEAPGVAQFVAWPAAGFFPAPLNTRFWSLSRAGANFSAATISMTTAGGVVVPVVKQAVVSGYADNTVAWEVPVSARMTAVAADTRFQITVAGISGAGIPSSYTYSVTLMDPNVVTSDQALIGTAAPPTSGVAKYLFKAPTKAESVQVNSFQPLATAWTEGAEDATQALVIDRRYLSSSYPLRSSVNSYGGGSTNFFRTGSKAFRLTFPTGFDLLVNGPRDQIFELDRMILPKAGAQLRFYVRQALMTSLTRLRVEASDDDGATWSAAGSDLVGNVVVNPSTGQIISGAIDNAFTLRTLSLPTSDKPLRVRFRFFREAFGITYAMDQLNDAMFPTGIFIDDITTANCDWLDLKKINEFSPAVSEINFNPTNAGGALSNGHQWRLRMRTKLGNRWMPYGPMKPLTVTSTALTGYDGWASYEYPDVTGGFLGDPDGDGVVNGMEYAFALDPRVPTPVQDPPVFAGNFLTLNRPLAGMRPGVSYTVEWSENLGAWSTAGTSLFQSGGVLIGRVPKPSGAVFMRWKITKQ